MIGLSAILSDLGRDGFSVVRGCFAPDRIAALSTAVDELYAAFPDRYHVEPRELRSLGRPPLHDAVFELSHHRLLQAFLGPWEVSESTATRRIGPRDGTHMPALAAHVDAFFHSFDLTLNFWTPLQACGDGVIPGLSLWKSPVEEAKRIVSFNPDAPPSGDWNFSRFSERWCWIAHGWENYDPGGRISPRFELGDACVMTNWTIHATGPGNPEARRSNVELRFVQSGSPPM
jgi:hypothetical protein